MTLAIVPAKGESKRFPGKNLARLGGRPLLDITVEKIRASGRFEQILVSSEDPRILEAAERLGAEAVPRPPELAQDPVQVGGVCAHLLTEEQAAGRTWPWFGVFLVTNPLIPVAAIQEAVDRFHATGARATASVVPIVHPPQRALRIRDDRLEPFMDVDLSLGAEAHEILYRHDGGALILRTADFESDGLLLAGDVRPIILDHENSVDIDTPHDLQWAEFVLSRRRVDTSR